MHELRKAALYVTAQRLRQRPACPVDRVAIAKEVGVEAEILETWFPFDGLIEREIRNYQFDAASQVRHAITTAQLGAHESWRAAFSVLGLKLVADQLFRASILCCDRPGPLAVRTGNPLPFPNLASLLTAALSHDDRASTEAWDREKALAIQLNLTTALTTLDAHGWERAEDILQQLGEELLAALPRESIAHVPNQWPEDDASRKKLSDAP